MFNSRKINGDFLLAALLIISVIVSLKSWQVGCQIEASQGIQKFNRHYSNKIRLVSALRSLLINQDLTEDYKNKKEIKNSKLNQSFSLNLFS